MCKHVAAVMYGAGARLDIAPDLLFTLRGVDRSELIVDAGADLEMTRTGIATERLLAEDDVAALFGIEMAPRSEAVNNGARSPAAPARRATSSGIQPAKEVPARERQPIKKRQKPAPRGARPPAAPPAIETRKRRTGAVAKSPAARTAPENIEPPHETVRARAKPSKKRVSSAELSGPQTQTEPHRQNRTKAARWVNSRARKRG